jgi:DNA-binding response OmpR family regulator
VKILVVEDDRAGRDVLVRALEREGYSVIWAATGEAAIQHLTNEQPIDVVLLDLNLPMRVSGYEIAGRMRFTPEWWEIPIIVVTGEGIEDIRRHSVNPLLGVDAIVRKPISLDLILAQIRRIEERKEQRSRGDSEP